MLFLVDQPLTETQGWWIVVELGIIALITLIAFLFRMRSRP